MRRTVMGIPLYEPRVTRGVQRPRSHSPARSARYVWRVGSMYAIIEWRRYTGYYPVSLFRLVSGLAVDRFEFPDLARYVVKKWDTHKAPTKPEDQVPVTSVVLKKFPRLLAFLSDLWYDDGSARVRGSIWMDSDLGGVKALLKEPSLTLCARIRAASWDELYAAVEFFLAMDSPPWEHDQFAARQQSEKKKK